ncbi:MAG TPA: tRNA (guanosine(37)-N1)-methyltransferase TrmD [Thermoanaerobaculia bacterium]|jgi:tRNA (guanine37-N1)-methyltransferase|nr:tRNA (guanosine(37)-N1)-methyltransferase TrmD [Thermoanaerobaculia bacterium]
MRVRVLTIFPELFEPFLSTSLIGKAREKGLLDVRVFDLRQFTEDRHRSVDDEPYGGGGGMVMTAPPWIRAVRAVSEEGSPWRVLLSPQGARLDEAKVRELAARAAESGLVLLCGRYEGIDERVRQTVVDEEVSIGDYVLSGGELPAMVLIEALSRQVPGVVGLADSVANDSFRGGLLDYPHYTRPPVVEGLAVPAVLTSGDHAAIRRWREGEALRATRAKRPDLLAEEGKERMAARAAGTCEIEAKSK